MVQVEELHGEDIASCYLSVHKLVEAVGIEWERGRRKRETRREHTDPRTITIIKTNKVTLKDTCSRSKKYYSNFKLLIIL